MRNLRITEWLCLLPSSTLILITFMILYLNGFDLDDNLRIIVSLNAVLGISCLAGFIKTFLLTVETEKKINISKYEKNP